MCLWKECSSSSLVTTHCRWDCLFAALCGVYVRACIRACACVCVCSCVGVECVCVCVYHPQLFQTELIIGENPLHSLSMVLLRVHTIAPKLFNSCVYVQ